MKVTQQATGAYLLEAETPADFYFVGDVDAFRHVAILSARRGPGMPSKTDGCVLYVGRDPRAWLAELPRGAEWDEEYSALMRRINALGQRIQALSALMRADSAAARSAPQPLRTPPATAQQTSPTAPDALRHGSSADQPPLAPEILARIGREVADARESFLEEAVRALAQRKSAPWPARLWLRLRSAIDRALLSSFATPNQASVGGAPASGKDQA